LVAPPLRTGDVALTASPPAPNTSVCQAPA
jgi:hypothetical protein